MAVFAAATTVSAFCRSPGWGGRRVVIYMWPIMWAMPPLFWPAGRASAAATTTRLAVTVRNAVARRERGDGCGKVFGDMGGSPLHLVIRAGGMGGCGAASSFVGENLPARLERRLPGALERGTLRGGFPKRVEEWRKHSTFGVEQGIKLWTVGWQGSELLAVG